MAGSVFLLSTLVISAAASSLSRRQTAATYDCTPGQSCWPTSEEWSSFNDTVDGALFKTVPFAAPCYLSNAAYNYDQCQDIITNYTSSQARADVYGSTQEIQYETCGDSQCLLESLAPALLPLTETCSLGSLAAYYVDARTSDQVSATLDFIKAHNIRLSIKNTGHDYLGRSVSPNSLALWTHHINTLDFFDTYTPKDCSTAGTISNVGEMGAGVMAYQAYPFFGSHGVDICGGNDATVGLAGGFGQAAGHGAFGPTYGLMVDQAIEFDVVTADGTFRTINECNDPDLFWAMRGGGAGTYAVLLAYRFKTFPQKSIYTYHFQASFSIIGEAFTDSAILKSLISAHISNSTNWSNSNVTGRFYYASDHVDFLVTLPAGSGGDATLKSLTASFRSGITSISGLTIQTDNYTTYATYADYDAFAQPEAQELTPTGLAAVVGSRLIPRSLFESTNQASLANATLQGIQTAFNLGSWVEQQPTLLVVMTTPANNPDSNQQTSANPAWRSALWHAIFLGGWVKGFPTSTQQETIQRVYDAAQPFRDLTPGGGSYMNEDSILVEDWQESFFGANYDKLLQIKDQYDPTHLFDCFKCVGWRGAAE